MTYRDAYMQLYPEADRETVHLGRCPDCGPIPGTDKIVIDCPAESGAMTEGEVCGFFWDQEIPEDLLDEIQFMIRAAEAARSNPAPEHDETPAAEPEEALAEALMISPGAKAALLVEILSDDSVRTRLTQSGAAAVVLMALSAVRGCAKAIYDILPDNPIEAEKIIHAMQESLNPTAPIWDLSWPKDAPKGEA